VCDECLMSDVATWWYVVLRSCAWRLLFAMNDVYDYCYLMCVAAGYMLYLYSNVHVWVYTIFKIATI
jgi:hypothetical protein